MARIDGTPGDDKIRGKEGPRNVIRGLDGDDTLFGGNNRDHLVGGAGDDRIYGGAGNDVLSGGRGRDHFVYSSFDDIAASSPDTIRDFTQEQDKLLFRGDYQLSVSLHFIGDNVFSGIAGEVRYQSGGDSASIIQIDLDGDKFSDAMIVFYGNIAFTAGDFSF